jgi:hypothetical protein
MGTIYAAASETLVARAGKDSTHGIPGVSIQRPFCERVKIGSLRISLLVEPSLQAIMDSIWATRGWTLQEGLMSNRLIVFTDHQILYICNSKVNYEAGRRIKLDQPAQLRRLSACLSPLKWDLEEAYNIIEQYSTRYLGNDSTESRRACHHYSG